MSWLVTVRREGRVRKLRHRSLEDAIRSLEDAAREVERAPAKSAVDLRVRRFEASELIAARVEVSGPRRPFPAVRAGVDVRGDGSAAAWAGRLSRRVIEPAPGETAYHALRRELGDAG
jgi:hypothetical protein